MHVTADTLVIVAIVGAALVFLARRIRRAVRSTRSSSAGGCDSGCCDSGGSSKGQDWAET